MAKTVDVAPEIAKIVLDEFESQRKKSRELARILTAVEKGMANYEDANNFAILIGEMMAAAFSKITQEMLPDGKMYYNIAQSVVSPNLHRVYEEIAHTVEIIQQELNRNAGLGLKAFHPEMNLERAEGIVRKVSQAEQYADASWVLREPVINFAQSVVSDGIEKNASLQRGVGLNPIITRVVAGNCCKWCANLAGTYNYDDLPKDIYRRHAYCRCMVLYDPGDGRRQNVHTKQWEEDPKLIERRRQFGLKTDDAMLHPIHPLTGERYNEPEMKMTDQQLGRKIGKHAVDFGLDPRKEADRAWIVQYLKNVWMNPDERCYGEWRNQQYPVVFHIKGDDVVVENHLGMLITLMKGGTQNARVKNARRRKI